MQKQKWFRLIYLLLPVSDIQQAVRLMGLHDERGFNPSKPGVIRALAGGHPASITTILYNLSDDRPNFQTLFYYAIYFSEGNAKKLFGENYSKGQIKRYSSNLQVTKNTPPSFILQTSMGNRTGKMVERNEKINNKEYYEKIFYQHHFSNHHNDCLRTATYRGEPLA